MMTDPAIEQGRPAVPFWHRTWRHMLITERIAELCDAKLKAFTDPADGMFYGSPRSVRSLIGGAIEAFEVDEDLDEAGLRCEAAEHEIIAEGCKFRRLSSEAKLAWAEDEDR
jgi:hypothetical protein